MFKIALAGNPNCGKTTLFNALTGFNQFVGNWPGVTVEKKEGKLKKHDDIIVTDLPGIYSLSPYTLEEIVARNYLLNEKPDVILNLVDGTNLERNLYLTTQLRELGIPMVVAVNMEDTLKKRGDIINKEELSLSLKCPVVGISALKETGINEAIEKTIEIAKEKFSLLSFYSAGVEKTISLIEEALNGKVSMSKKRWYAVKIFEGDEETLKNFKEAKTIADKLEKNIVSTEKEFDDDRESIITNERYNYISLIINKTYQQKHKNNDTVSDKIDRIVTNRFLGLPIFMAVMFIVYFLSISTVGTWATDWTNDNLFGDGWFLLGKGSEEYEEVKAEYDLATTLKDAFEKEASAKKINPMEAKNLITQAKIYDDNGEVTEILEVNYEKYNESLAVQEPDPNNFGPWIRGIPVVVKDFLENIKCAEWLNDLILNGIIAGVGSVLGFVPQMFVLFILLAFLESCGYMARIAFIMDRIFHKFGLSGKSFIPMLIGTGCGVPAIMASRTIENDRDRKITIMTTTFIPCSAKLPIIALISGAMFKDAVWVAPSAYFAGIISIIISGIILKKTSLFKGDPAPFVMELPEYRLPTLGSLLRSMWERGSSFIKKAGTIILLATILVWFTSSFGWHEGKFGNVSMNESILAYFGSVIAWIFKPLGWGHWQGAVASITGLIAKENVVGTFGVLFGDFDEVAENGWQIWENMRQEFTPLSAYSFLIFNLLCAPCFAAMGAIKREMNNLKWTFTAITYQCLFAYVISLIVYQGGLFLNGSGNLSGTLIAGVMIILLLIGIFKPERK